MLRSLTLTCVLAALAGAATADELTMPQAPATVERPTRGMSMKSVEARFGAPIKRYEPVGHPPITRWEYPHFVVYFEYQHVIHAVAIG
jgi:hypothetical protein